MKQADVLVVGCGLTGLMECEALKNRGKKIIALEAGTRLGGSGTLAKRLIPGSVSFFDASHAVKKIQSFEATRIWWEHDWIAPHEVDWEASDWAPILPQWNYFFRPLDLIQVQQNDFDLGDIEILKEHPVSSLQKSGDTWVLQAKDECLQSSTIVWTLGLNSLLTCMGKKEAAPWLEKNTAFDEKSTDFENFFAATFIMPTHSSYPENTLLAIPVRHEKKLYLSFLRIDRERLQSFAYLPSEVLSQPKEVLFFEKSLRRTFKHVLGQEAAQIYCADMAIHSDHRAEHLSSLWTLKSHSGLIFLDDLKSSYLKEKSFASVENIVTL